MGEFYEKQTSGVHEGGQVAVTGSGRRLGG